MTGRLLRADRRERIVRQWYYLRLGCRLSEVAVGLRSKAQIVALGGVAVLKESTRWRNASVTPRIRFEGRVFATELATRSDLDVLREVVLEREYELPDGIPPAVIVDLGAHIGLASLFFAARLPHARIVAVEANPRLLPRLRRNLAATHAQVIHAAVGDRDGHRSLHRGEASWASSLIAAPHSSAPIRVPALTLESLLGVAGIDRVDLLKIDIEGAEWEILGEGVPDFVGVLLGEVHAIGDRPPSGLFDAISASHDLAVLREAASGAVIRATPKRGHASPGCPPHSRA